MIEMLMVIGIICILTFVLFPVIGSVLASSEAAVCKGNLKDLANAVIAYTQKTDEHWLPRAGCSQSSCVLFEYNGGNYQYYTKYGKKDAWIHWLAPGGAYPKTVKSGEPGPITPNWIPSFSASSTSSGDKKYKEDTVEAGTLWPFVKNHKAYVCPTHRDLMKKAGVKKVWWSYVMNDNFKYDTTDGKGTACDMNSDYAASYTDMGNLERTLLFAELPGVDVGAGVCDKVVQKGNTQYDAVLNCSDGHKEAIGFNHKLGKTPCAHVVFLDSHIEVLRKPGKPDAKSSKNELVNLTANLCNGVSLSFSGGHYLNPEGKY